ncbi:MAG: pyridoxamine 5'-phosphate oxidase family protein [Limisphaerales bacterium]
MNSINKNQPEKNREDLSGARAVQRIKDVVDKAKTCFFRTGASSGESEGVRPMNVREVDSTGRLWFLMASDSHTVQELNRQPNVDLFFQGSAHSDFLHLAGTATLSRDPARIKQLWEPVLKTWFTGGENDPRITVVQVAPTRGYYWDNKHGNIVAGVKILLGAATGQTLDDSIEGKIRV